MKALLLLLITFECAVVQAQINKNGLPFITNYIEEIKENTGGAVQMWDGVQDKRGVLYFGNQNGVLEYDGHFWNRIPTDNYTPYSLAVDERGIVHVGSYNEFGSLLPNENGELEYVSSRSALPDSLFFSEIYHIYCINGATYYCCFECIIVEKDNDVKVIEFPFEDAFWSFNVGDSILISSTNEFYVLYNDTISRLEIPYKGGCYGMVPLEGDKYLTLDLRSVQKLDLKALKSDSVSNSVLINSIKEGMSYSLKKYGNDNVFSFIGNNKCYCLVVADNDIQIKNVLNQKYGLASNVVVNSFQAGNQLWALTTSGISKIEMNRPITQVGLQMGINASINDVIEFEDCIYISTESGVSCLNYDDGIAEVRQISDGAAFYFAKIILPDGGKEELLVTDLMGISIIDSKTHEAHRWQLAGGGGSLFQSKKYPENIYFSSNSEICLLHYNSQKKKWEQTKLDIEGECTSINEDKEGNIWFSLNRQSIVKYSQTDSKTTSYVENDGCGLSSLYQVMICNVNDTLLFCSDNGVYEFDEGKSKFVLSNILGSYGKDSTHSYWNVLPYGAGHIVLNYNENTQSTWVSYIYGSGDKKIFRTPFYRLPNEVFTGACVDSKGNFWLPLGNVLYCYCEDAIDKEHPYYAVSFDSHIRKVLLNDSIVLFGGTMLNADSTIGQKQEKNNIPYISYKNNSLVFQYSATFYEQEDKLEYSTILEGADETWSIWKKGNEYARYGLREGSYTFKVKAKNIYGVESSVAEYSFVIKPPFYRTIFAYIVYILALVAAVFGIVKWNTHRLIEDKKKLERKIAEATEEIRGQNVQLEQQKNEIEKQKDEIQASINYARRIQRALLTPDETIDAVFPDHFLLYKPRNIVSGDYYWIGQFGDNKVCIVADCTGHGVPGGFMSMLGMTNLNYIVGQELRPDEILNKLRKAIITSLRQKDDSIVAQLAENGDAPIPTEKKDRSQDGMDVAMYVINEKEMTLSFAGANNPLVLIRDGEVQVVKASKMPVGIYAKLDPFERVDMELKKGDCLYTFSDGFQDQFGQETGRKFMSKHLREVLLEIHQKPMAEQKEILNKTYEDWRGPADLQTDDVVLMGVRI